MIQHARSKGTLGTDQGECFLAKLICLSEKEHFDLQNGFINIGGDCLNDRKVSGVSRITGNWRKALPL